MGGVAVVKLYQNRDIDVMDLRCTLLARVRSALSCLLRRRTSKKFKLPAPRTLNCSNTISQHGSPEFCRAR